MPITTQTKAPVKKADFSVSISIPQGSGLAFNNYMRYEVENDTLYVIDSGAAIDTAHIDTVLKKYSIGKENINKLKNAVSRTDSLGDQTNLCIPIQLGRTRFFISFNDNGRKRYGFIANIYRQDIFEIVDILNGIYTDGEIISYDKKELIQQEMECNKKINKKLFL